MKLKQIFCSHKELHLGIDLDEIKDKNVSAKCERCKLKVCFRLTTYSMFTDDTRANGKRNNGCKKRNYTKREAETQLNRCQGLKRKTQPTRIYECHRCKNWHLTSKK